MTVSPEDVLRELAADGAWTTRQLEARVHRWGAVTPDAYLAWTTVAVRPTGWSHRRMPVQIAYPNGAARRLLAALRIEPQLIRAEELEHALGLAELRWHCEVRADRYRAQDLIRREHGRARAHGLIGYGPALADGVAETDDGLVLCEYDHGRYTSRQVLAKLAAFRSLPRLHGRPVAGVIWGVPTEGRAARLRHLGVDQVIVVRPETWLY